MGLFSFLRKNKQDPASGDGEFYSRAEEESTTARGRGKRKGNQAKEPVDPVLPEKKRARRRLVGAIALVLAAIIGLPMIFDSEPKPVADDITIKIPSKEKSATQRLDSNRPATSSLFNVPAAATLSPKEEIVGTSNSMAAPIGPATAADKVSALAASKSEPKHAHKPSAKIESKVEHQPTVPANHKATDARTVKASVEAQAINSAGPKIADKKNGKFVLQVAALESKEKINELQAKLKKAGFATSTQKISTASGVSTRIRVGPYGTKEEADKARAKLSKMGLKGTPVPMVH